MSSSRITFGVLASFVLSGPYAVGATVALKELTEVALKSSPELREAEQRADAEEKQASSRWGRFLPEISADAGWETFRSTSQTKTNSFGYLSGRYNLFRGGADRFAYLALSRSAETALGNVGRIRAKITRQVESEYASIAFLQKAVIAIKDAVVLTDQQASMAQKKKQAGLTSDADVLEFELRKNSLQADLVLREQELTSARASMSRILGGSDTATLEASQDEQSIRRLPNRERLLEKARVSRIDIRDADRDLVLSEYAVNSTRSNWMPRVDVEALYGRLSLELRQIDPVPQGAVMLKASIPLFNGLSDLNERKSLIATKSANEARLAGLQLEARSEIDSALARIDAVLKRLDLESKNLLAAKKYYEVTLSEYRRGVKNSPDLAGASERLLSSHVRYAELHRDLVQSRVALAEAAGVSTEELQNL